MNLIPHYFGKTHYPRIVGFALPFSTILGSLGSPVTGWIRDSTGSYKSAWELAIIILTIGLVSLILARPPVHPSMRENRADSIVGVKSSSINELAAFKFARVSIIGNHLEKEGIMKTSRRNFLKATATGMSTAALAGLGSIEAEATQFDQVKKWDYEAGVVVLGTGAAGLMTAMTAHDQGADVLILEKAPEAHAGGNTRVSGQGYWCPSDSDKAVEYQKAMGDGYSIPDDMVRFSTSTQFM